MSQTKPRYQLKSHMKVDEANNVTGLDPIGNVVVGAYLKIQDGVVGTYKKIEDKFVDAFLEPVPEDKSE